MASRKKHVHAFVDTNIFLDFYRANNESTLKLLEKLMGIKKHIISTYQVEMEFMKNRQQVIVDAFKNINTQQLPTMPAILADSRDSNSLKTLNKNASEKVKLIKKRILTLLKSPKASDTVYQSLDDIFHSPSKHVLTRDMNIRHKIKRLAWRRFILGYPPRKNSDNSTGDALNWEWIIHCGQQLPGEIIIVSRDSDYGATVEGKSFLNDHLLQEYKDRVGIRKRITYTTKLSEALKRLHVSVTKKEEEAEVSQIKMEAFREFMKTNLVEERRKREEKEWGIIEPEFGF